MAAKRPASSQTLLVVAVEILAVGLFTLLAGASDEAGSIMVLVMVAFWLIYMITNSAVIAGLSNGLINITKGG